MSDAQRLRVFDNGITTAAFVSGLQGRDVLVVTFDPFTYVNPDQPGFGEAVLTADGYDVLAFQKREENFYQDLSRQDVAEVLRPYQPRYRRVVFYGCSVGGYAVLYFGAGFDADILSISPRVSTHPIYVQELKLTGRRAEMHRHGPIAEGGPARAGRVALIYDPILVHQPAARADILFMEQEILPAFPGISVHALRHTGHPCTSSLAETHQLRPLLLQFLDRGFMDFGPYQRMRRESPTYMMNFSAWLLEKGKIGWANDVAARAVELAPHLADVHFQRSHAHLARREFTEARHAAARGMGIDPHRHFQRLRLLNAFEAAGDVDGMVEIIAAAMDLPDAMLAESARCAMAGQAAQLLEKAGKTEAALGYALRAVGTKPQHHLVQYVGQLQLKLGRWDAALESLDRAVALRDSIAVTHQLRGQALLELGRIDDARLAFQRAVELQSRDRHLALQLAELHAMAYEAQEARRILKQFTDDPGLDASLLTSVARVQMKLAEDRAAIETLKRAMHLAPEDMQVRLLLAKAHRGLGQAAAALQLTGQALALRPDHAPLQQLQRELREEVAAFS